MCLMPESRDPNPGPVDQEAAARMLQIMADLGGEELVGKMVTLPDGVFW